MNSFLNYSFRFVTLVGSAYLQSFEQSNKTSTWSKQKRVFPCWTSPCFL